MAFHIQTPSKRNLLLEGLVQGINRGEERQDQMELIKNQQMRNQSALQSLLPNRQPQQENGQDDQEPQSFFQTDPITAYTSIALSGADPSTQKGMWQAYELGRKEADIPLDVISKEALQSKGFSLDDLNNGIVLPEEIAEVNDLRQYLSKHAKSEKDIPELVSRYGQEKQKAAFEKYLPNDESAKSQLFGQPQTVEKPQPAGSIEERRLQAKKNEIKAKLEAEREAKKIEEKEHLERPQKAFDEMAYLVNKGNLGRGSNITSELSDEATEDYASFKSANAALEGILSDLVSNGKLTDVRFNYIVDELLPKPNDRKSAIKGKMKSIALIVGLDPSALDPKSASKSENKNKPTSKAPAVGSKMGGYKFLGGNPADQKSWEKI